MSQIDQSGKIEDTAKNTVLAFANSSIGAVIITKKEKRKLQDYFRRVGMPTLYVYVTFTTLLFILIKKIPHTTWIIDREYPGHERMIEAMFSILSQDKHNFHWKLIGKSSPAHDIAYKVYAKKITIARKVNAEEVWKIAQKIIAGGYLKTGLSPANRHSAPANKQNIPKPA